MATLEGGYDPPGPAWGRPPSYGHWRGSTDSASNRHFPFSCATTL